MSDTKPLKQRIDAILGRNCPALGRVSAEGISVIRKLEQNQGVLISALDLLLTETVDMDLKHGIALSEGEEYARNNAIFAIAEALGQTKGAA
jgi:hypothetical protein